MDASTTPNPAGPDLPNGIGDEAICYLIAQNLRTALPPLPSDAPEDAARRDRAAIARVAALLPATIEEADIATLYIAAQTQALECIRLARQFPADGMFALKCTALSGGMMRQALRWRALLHRLQDARRKSANDSASSEAAATEQRALGMLTEALAQIPPAPRTTTQAAERPEQDPVAEAEQYALHHRKRAALIRRLGRMPEKINIGWLRPAVVHAIATGDTPILRALGDMSQRRMAVAA
jgi:hypothetical protein